SAILLSAILLLPALPAQAQKSVPEATQPPILDGGAAANPNKIAQLHWYVANLSSPYFDVGSQPYGLCFDGANLWAANFGGNTVTKVRANDGAVLGTFTVGSQPYGVTYDGASVWV